MLNNHVEPVMITCLTVSRYRGRLEVRALGQGPTDQELVSPYYSKVINDYDTVGPHYEFAENSIAKVYDTPVRKSSQS